MRKVTCFVLCFIVLAGLACFASTTAPTPSTWGDFYIGWTDYTVLPSPHDLTSYAGTSSLGYWAAAYGGSVPSMYARAWVWSNYTGAYGTAGFDLHETYYYQNVTPGPMTVPVSWAYAGHIDGTAFALNPGDEGIFSVYGNLDGQGDSPWYQFGYECVNAPPYQNCSSYTLTEPGSQSGYVQSNTWIAMKMYMYGGVEVDNIGGAVMNAYLDPTVTIDPAWLAAHPGTGIEYSVPSNATPEPSSLLLLGTGLVGIIGIVRRKFVE